MQYYNGWWLHTSNWHHFLVKSFLHWSAIFTRSMMWSYYSKNIREVMPFQRLWVVNALCEVKHFHLCSTNQFHNAVVLGFYRILSLLSSNFIPLTKKIESVKEANMQGLFEGNFTQASNVSWKYVGIIYCTASHSPGHTCLIPSQYSQFSHASSILLVHQCTKLHDSQ